MDARGAIPAGDEPADLHDRRFGVETGPPGGGPNGSTLRGSSSARERGRRGWSADQRTLDDGAIGWQSKREVGARRHTPDRAVGALEPPVRVTRARSRNPNCDLHVHTARRAIQLCSCPEVSTSVESATSPGTVVTRRLLMEETRVLSAPTCQWGSNSAVRDMPPLRARRLILGRRSKGA